MKLYNRIMSFVLSPGAYALWRSAENPDEWRKVDAWVIRHKHSSVDVYLPNLREVAEGMGKLWIAFPFALIVFAMVWLMRPLACDLEDRYEGAVGLIDWFIIAGRLFRLRKKVFKALPVSKRERNRSLFAALTVGDNDSSRC